MKQTVKLITTLIAPLILTGCLFLPGKFDAKLKLTGGGQYEFSYTGEMQVFAGGEREMRPPKLESFDPKNAVCREWTDADGKKRTNSFYDRYRSRHDGDIAETTAAPPIVAPPPSIVSLSPKRETRKCTEEELTKLKTQEIDRHARKKKEHSERASAMAMFFGGAIPGNDDSMKQFAQKLLKYDGWEKVEYAGDNVFKVEYRASGTFDRYFAFPTLKDTAMQYPFFHIMPRKSGALEILSPAIGGSSSNFASFAAFGAIGGGKNKDFPLKNIEGSFTIETDGEILANNNPDGYETEGDRKVIRWNVQGLNNSPRALIQLK